MNVTALIVELLVVGIGTATWLALFVAGSLRYEFDSSVFSENPALIWVLLAVVYVLGVVMDRIVRIPFMSIVEKRAKDKIFTKAIIEHILRIAPYICKKNLSMELEKFIRTESDALARKIDYNRSRLRMCRAWAIHFALIAVSLTFWKFRVSVLSTETWSWLLGGDILFLVMTVLAAFRLSTDHQRDLEESFRITTKSAHWLVNADQ